jgi:hypothetical protein
MRSWITVPLLLAALAACGTQPAAQKSPGVPTSSSKTSTPPAISPHQPSAITGPAGTLDVVVKEPPERADSAIRYLRIEDATGKPGRGIGISGRSRGALRIPARRPLSAGFLGPGVLRPMRGWARSPAWKAGPNLRHPVRGQGKHPHPRVGRRAGRRRLHDDHGILTGTPASQPTMRRAPMRWPSPFIGRTTTSCPPSGRRPSCRRPRTSRQGRWHRGYRSRRRRTGGLRAATRSAAPLYQRRTAACWSAAT